MRTPPSNRQLEAAARFGRLAFTEPAIDRLIAAALRVALAETGAGAGLVVERTVGNRLVTVCGTDGFTAPPALRDLAVPSRWHMVRALEAAGGRVSTGDLLAAPDEPPVFAHQGWRSVTAIRIGDPARPFGVAGFYTRTPGTLPTNDLLCLESLVASLGVAIERVQAKAEVDRERDERFRLASLIEGSDDAIVVMRLDGTIGSWNPGAERLYGFAAHEIVGRDVALLVPSEREADRQRMLEHVGRGERIPSFDAEHRRKDGSAVMVSLSLSPIHDQHGAVTAIAGIAHDVTETRRLESQLLQSAKMEAVGRLAGGLAHDFNNMLTVIDGYSELVLMKLPADHAVRGLIEEIHRAGERAAGLTRQLMAFSRKSMVEPQVLNLSDVVRADVEMLARIIGADVSIEMRLGDGLDHVMADRAQVEQVLFNLILNARDAMPGGGRVVIETANVPATGVEDDVPADVPAGQYVLLRVSDTGIGMDAETKARIFEPFFTTKGSGRGTGLGLPMLQTFVTQSGGHVVVDSTVGEGTTFRIYLPTVPLPVAAAHAPPTADAPAGTETVLVVEDEAAVRVYAEAVLRAAGYQVLTAANGADALDVARATDTIHLLIADIVMPVLGGFPLAEQFAAIHPRARVLFTSGYTPEAVSRRGITIAPELFVQKPFAPAALCRRIRDVLG